MSSTSRSTPLPSTRPTRADARRNYDLLVAAAREAFAEHGTDTSLEEIARRGRVGIGTLYRRRGQGGRHGPALAGADRHPATGRRHHHGPTPAI